jgi:hypothetical protein
MNTSPIRKASADADIGEPSILVKGPAGDGGPFGGGLAKLLAGSGKKQISFV